MCNLYHNDSKWSKWKSFNELDSDSNSDLKQFGLYRVRSAVNGIPNPIRRFFKDDDHGLILIGLCGKGCKDNSIENLYKRLLEFWKKVNNGGHGHSEGKRFNDYNYIKKIDIKSLEYSIISFSRTEVGEKEKELLHQYNLEFLDMPLLNRNIG